MMAVRTSERRSDAARDEECGKTTCARAEGPGGGGELCFSSARLLLDAAARSHQEEHSRVFRTAKEGARFPCVSRSGQEHVCDTIC